MSLCVLFYKLTYVFCMCVCVFIYVKYTSWKNRPAGNVINICVFA